LKNSTKLTIGKMLIPANLLSMLIVGISIIGTHVAVQTIDCNSDSNMTGYNQLPYGNDHYPSDTISGKKQYCESQVKQAKDFVSNNTTLALIGYSIMWAITIFLLVTGKKGLEKDKQNYKDPSHGTLPKGYKK
jgi:hypothetical protein